MSTIKQIEDAGLNIRRIIDNDPTKEEYDKLPRFVRRYLAMRSKPESRSEAMMRQVDRVREK